MEKGSKIAPARKLALLYALLFFCSAIPAYAASVTLKWDANTEPDLDHYVIYWGTSSGIYPNSVNVLKDTNTHRVTGLAANSKYYFVVRAVDDENNESANSREISLIKHDHLFDGQRDTEWKITSGDLKGFKFVFDSSGEIPTLGPASEIPALNLPGVNPLGSRMNLQPSPNYFSTPVKIFVPCSGYSDLSVINVYHYDDVEGKWMLADDADHWLVPGSLEENYDTSPRTLSMEVNHFSGVQAGTTSESGGGGGCFIATAAFGSEMERHVEILSEFRDKRLLTNQLGRRFVDTYYKLSPPVADYLREHPTARTAVKYALVPITGVAYLALHIHPLILLLGFVCLILSTFLCYKRFHKYRI